MADKPNITKEAYIAQLVRVGAWAAPQNPIQYSFLEQKPAYLPNEPGWSPVTAAQRAAIQHAFAMIAEVVNLTFVQVPDTQQQPGPGNPRINFYANSVNLNYSGSMSAYRIDGSSAIYGADIRFNTARIAQRQSNEGFEDFTTFVALHEIMHGIGLSHPGNYNGQGFNYKDHAEFVEDTIQYTTMSYFAAAAAGADHSIGSVLYTARTPLLYDIAALQTLYAPNMNTRSGDTVYGFNSNTGAGSPFNFAVTTGPVIAIWDGGGIDTIDLSGYAEASLIDLNEGAFSDAGGLTKNIAIAFNVTIENAVGGKGNDRLIGNAVANRLDGGAGADRMEGGPGDDLYIVDDPGDLVVELAGAGKDEVRTALATYVLPANVELLTGISSAAQTLGGNALANVIAAGAGDDTLSGGAGDDLLSGGAGNADTAVFAGKRADYEIGTAGKVTVRDLNPADGDEGTDTLEGIEFIRFADMTLALGVGANNPPQLGSPAVADQSWADGVPASYTVPESSFVDLDGNHTLSFAATLADGSPLPAWLSFDAAKRTFRGTPPFAAIGTTLTVRITASDGLAGASDDFLIGVTEAPGANVEGTEAADTLDGTFRSETMIGAGGDDVLRGSAGADRLDGGAGIDEADYSASPAGVTIDLITGRGTGGDAQGDTLISIERVTGSAHADRMVGGADANRFDGGAGADRMEGGAGDDLYVVDDPGDAAIELADQGTDEVRTSLASYVLAANVERLTGTSSAGQMLTGNGLANRILGGGGNDVVDGGAGADEMRGGAGDDVYAIDEAGDQAIENAGEGTDEIRTGLAAFSLAALANMENLSGTSASGQTLTGNGGANVITGASGNDVIDGGAGADIMRGGAGNDLYFADDSSDLVVENAGDGSDEVRTAAASYSLSAHVETLTGISASGQVLTGNDLANVISGGGGDDTLFGGGGDDRLFGGAGNDAFNAGAGNDFIDGGPGADIMGGLAGDDVYLVDHAGDRTIEAEGEGTDEVRTGLAAYALEANVENLTGTSAAGQELVGNGSANSISGGSGNDLIDGGAGADRMAGGAGDDIYIVDDAGDQVVELAGEGRTRFARRSPPTPLPPMSKT
jgi:Ca2+-binding RTX toxin-like protein